LGLSNNDFCGRFDGCLLYDVVNVSLAFFKNVLIEDFAVGCKSKCNWFFLFGLVDSDENMKSGSRDLVAVDIGLDNIGVEGGGSLSLDDLIQDDNFVSASITA
jgi:hypothetical protein